MNYSVHSDMFMFVMTRDEYERSKGWLEEQRRVGIELIETAYQAQVRALDLVWMLQVEGAGAERATALVTSEPAAPAADSPAPLPAAEPAEPRWPIEWQADLRAGFSRLPESFTRRDICELLGYEPGRASLFRYLKDLVAEGVISIEAGGEGRRATVYRRQSDELPALP